MAKSFVAASSQYFSATGAPITALPCTIACFARTDGAGGNRTAVSLDTAAGSARVQLGLNSTAQVSAVQSDTTNTTQTANTTATTTTNTQYHIAGVFASNTSRTAYLDGVAGAANTNSNTFTAPDTVRLGVRTAASALGNYWSGRLAEVGIWSVALTTDQIASLASGVSPLLVRPDALVFYAPLLTNDSNVADWVGGLSLTPTNSPTDADHPPQVAYLSVGSPLQAFSVGTPAPTISSTSDTNTLIDESALTINGANLTSATAVTFKQTDRANFDATAYIDTNGATSIVLDPIDIQVMGYAYGAATVAVTTAGGTTADFAITISPASGTQYVTLAGHTTGTGYATDLASANGDQLTAPDSVAGSTVTVDADGNISFTPDVPDGTTFTREWFDASADTWATDTVQIDGGEVADGDDEFLFRRHRYLAFQRTGRFNP